MTAIPRINQVGASPIVSLLFKICMSYFPDCSHASRYSLKTYIAITISITDNPMLVVNIVIDATTKNTKYSPNTSVSTLDTDSPRLSITTAISNKPICDAPNATRAVPQCASDTAHTHIDRSPKTPGLIKGLMIDKKFLFISFLLNRRGCFLF